MKQKYKIPENAEKQKEYIKQKYKIPENAEKKKQKLRNKYQTPEVALKKEELSQTSYNIPEKRKSKKKQSLQSYQGKKAKLSTSDAATLNNFRTLCKQYPIRSCYVCGRIMFRFQVKKLDKKKYKKPHVSTLLNSLLSEETKYICVLCDRTMNNGKIPAQALANNMDLSPVGAEINELNKLERHLVSPVFHL